MFDVTMTATLRPEIVEQTLQTFCQRLLAPTADKCLILNVDPVGNPAVTVQDVQKVALRYFPNCIVRTPRKANFPAALAWCWAQVQSPYFFNLEDDWVLLEELDLARMLQIMDQAPWLALLRLPKHYATETECRQSGSRSEPLYRWNGAYYECPAHQTKKNGYYGSPSLLRRTWAQGVLPFLSQRVSPEKRLRQLSRKRHPSVWQWEYGVYTNPNTEKTIVDIGTAWRQKRKIRKNSYHKFTTWVTG
jgi:hypothetical protein